MAATLETNDQLLELDQLPLIYQFQWREWLQVLLIGAVMGLLTPLLAKLMATYLIEPFFCQGKSSFAFCSEGGAIAYGVSLVMLSVAALLVLASLRTYQPLLNVVAPLIALWGLDQYFSALAAHKTLIYFAASVGLFALAYGLFYLLGRFRSLAISLVLAAAIVLLIRLQF